MNTKSGISHDVELLLEKSLGPVRIELAKMNQRLEQVHRDIEQTNSLWRESDALHGRTLATVEAKVDTAKKALEDDRLKQTEVNTRVKVAYGLIMPLVLLVLTTLISLGFQTLSKSHSAPLPPPSSSLSAPPRPIPLVVQPSR